MYKCREIKGICWKPTKDIIGHESHSTRSRRDRRRLFAEWWFLSEQDHSTNEGKVRKMIHERELRGAQDHNDSRCNMEDGGMIWYKLAACNQSCSLLSSEGGEGLRHVWRGSRQNTDCDIVTASVLYSFAVEKISCQNVYTLGKSNVRFKIAHRESCWGAGDYSWTGGLGSGSALQSAFYSESKE